MEKNVDYLKTLLRMKENQQKMLNNTLCEMIAKNSPKGSVDALKSEIDGVISEMVDIQSEIGSIGGNVDEATYSFYDTVKKLGKREMRLSENQGGIEKVKSNKFMVDFGGCIGTLGEMVKFMSFDYSKNEVFLSICDFVDKRDGDTVPLIKMLMDCDDGFTLYVYHFNELMDEVEYNEEFEGCRIVSLSRDPLNKDLDNDSMISIQVRYEDYKIK